MSSSDFAKSIETKIAKWGRVVKEGIIGRIGTHIGRRLSSYPLPLLG
jgi:hypothetical protein